ncbi:indolepyruvate oxidoreductase subunit beta [Thermanaeromonas sp. C210]|uniref:indolepyruvate oxidoreductase subunit beta n=1 Tax=Thermanaeromonas sp. C210 TaxID=2731925 RepID=UPI00155CC667|nr:indolepyruvate oxidoreductase subunit beta [Thermanaeromonas sp. C210]GFN21901.1 indolepyruvate oxidoreductase [Thermanaeromonas sp. C210]
MNREVTSILLVGVGGQGTVLAGRVLARAAMSLGGEVKVSDIHGMAQRGGSVVTQVRFGPKVYAPVVETGTADYLVAFEKLEACRWLPYLREDGQLIVNNQEIPPLPVLTGAAVYPPNLLAEMGKRVKNISVIDALNFARRAGNVKTLNMVLMGVLARHLPMDREAWEEALAESVPERFLEVNKRAFQLGWEAAL